MIDPHDGKRMNFITAINYIRGHQSLVHKFLGERCLPDDRDYVLAELMQDPVTFATTLKHNYEMSDSQKRRRAMEMISKEGKLTVILGAKGYGKTVTLTWALEYAHTKLGKNAYWYGYNKGMREHYPYITQTFDLTQIKEGTILGLDEAALVLDARDSMSKTSKEKIKMLPTMRHRGLAIAFASQSGQSVDTRVFQMADYIWFKPYFITDFDSRMNIPKYLKHVIPSKPNENLLYDLNTNIFYTFTNPMPSIWNDELSKLFSTIEDEQEAEELWDMLDEAGLSDNEIIKILEIRGWK